MGYATSDALTQALASKLDFDNAGEIMAVRAAELQQAFNAFRSRQIEGDGSVPTEHKQELHRRRRRAHVTAQARRLASVCAIGRSLDRWLMGP